MFLNIRHPRAITGTVFFPTPEGVLASPAVAPQPFPQCVWCHGTFPVLNTAWKRQERGREEKEFSVGEAEEGKIQFIGLPEGRGGAIT